MTVLERLRTADPAADHDPPLDEQLLHRLLVEPRPAPRRRRALPVRRLVAAGAVAAAAITGVAVFSGGGPTPDLAARAYAQTSAADQILYARTSSQSSGPVASTMTAEYWVYGNRAHYRTVNHDEGHPTTTFEMRIDAAGEVLARQSLVDGDRWRPVPAGEETLTILRRGFVAQFRHEYEAGRLDPAGDTSFAGRPAQRYVVDEDPLHSEYYVDKETAEPLGAIHTARYATRPDGPLVGEQRMVTTVEEISHLEPTAENLTKLT